MRIDVSAMTRLRNTSSRSTNASSEDQTDRERRPTGEHRREVRVLRGRPTDAGARNGGREPVTEPVDERSGPRIVDRRRAGHPHDGPARRSRCGHDAGIDDAGLRRRDPDDLRRVGRRNGDEHRRGGTRAERLHEHLVAVTARTAVVDDPGAGHPEMDADCREHQRAEQHDPDREDRARAVAARRRSTGPTDPRRRCRDPSCPASRAPCRRERRAGPAASVSDASATATTDRIIPSAIERNTMTGTRNTAARASTTVRAERNTALPAVESVFSIAAIASLPSIRSSR